MLKSIAREGLQMMTRLFWDLGEQGSDLLARHRAHRAQGQASEQLNSASGGGAAEPV